MNVCIIPARGGKTNTTKNIRNFCDKPMIAWSIEAAFRSDCFDRIIVSTDDEEIAQTARRYGAEVPFKRPEELSNDIAGTAPVITHAVKWLQERGQEPTTICCLYATAPFVEEADIKEGLELLRENTNERFVFTATAYPSPIQRALRLDRSSGEVFMWQPENFHKEAKSWKPTSMMQVNFTGDAHRHGSNQETYLTEAKQ